MFSQNTKFLVVDDFATMRKVVKKVLTELGYTDIHEAEDGKAAFQLIQDAANGGSPFQCIVSDWNMPNMTGLELLKACKADAKFKDTPFMLVTAESEKEQIIEAAKAGVSEYVVKPFNAATLKEKLGRVYAKHNGAKAAQVSTALKLSTLKHPIFEKLVVENICAGIKDTITKLGAFTLEFKPHFFAASWAVPTPISVIVNIKQNEQPLQVRFHFDPKPVIEILEGMLGDKVDPESQDILDGVGEISNMIYGLIKTKASTAGFQFGMGRPEACFTKNLPPTVAAGQSLVIPFTVNGSICHFEFIVFE